MGKLSYPYVKKSFKKQHGRIPIDPAILAAIRRRFIAKNADALIGGDAHGDQKPETLFGLFLSIHLIYIFFNLICIELSRRPYGLGAGYLEQDRMWYLYCSTHPYHPNNSGIKVSLQAYV